MNLNLQVFALIIITIFEDDLYTVKEYLKIALNTVFYHRWLKNNDYTEEESSINNIYYLKINKNSLQEEIKELLKKVENLSKTNNKFQITLNFYTEKVKRYYIYENLEGLWERWNFLVIISDKNSKDKETKIRRFISYILKELNDEKDFMPDIDVNLEQFTSNKSDSHDKSNFPFEIKVNTDFEQTSILSIINNKI